MKLLFVLNLQEQNGVSVPKLRGELDILQIT